MPLSIGPLPCSLTTAMQPRREIKAITISPQSSASSTVTCQHPLYRTFWNAGGTSFNVRDGLPLTPSSTCSRRSSRSHLRGHWYDNPSAHIQILTGSLVFRTRCCTHGVNHALANCPDDPASVTLSRHASSFLTRVSPGTTSHCIYQAEAYTDAVVHSFFRQDHSHWLACIYSSFRASKAATCSSYQSYTQAEKAGFQDNRA